MLCFERGVLNEKRKEIDEKSSDNGKTKKSK